MPVSMDTSHPAPSNHSSPVRRGYSFRPRHPSSTSSDGSPMQSTSRQRSASPTNGPHPIPVSALLQDLLREKKAETRRASVLELGAPLSNRRMSRLLDPLATDTREIQSSPLGVAQRTSSHAQRKGSSGKGGSVGAGSMGAREMEEYTSTLHKQNFDLKLELYHRRQRMVNMQEQIDKTKELEAENAELQEVNEQLLEELEKRDKAVEEAVTLICHLEQKVEELEANRPEPPRSLTQEPSPHGSASTESHSEVSTSSPKLQIDKASYQTPMRTNQLRRSPTKSGISSAVSSPPLQFVTPRSSLTPLRTPSFMTSDKGSAGALRSLFLATNESKPSVPRHGTPLRYAASVGSELNACRSPDFLADGLDSPRLSVLSESSFLSVYGEPRKLNLDDQGQHWEEHQDDTRQTPPDRDIAASRTDHWIHANLSSPKRANFVPVGRNDGGHFQSLSDVLNSPSRVAARRRKSEQTENELPTSMGEQRRDDFAVSALCPSRVLPPTPDTMSTADQVERFGGSPGVVAEKSLLDGTPAPARFYNALLPYDRPRSSGHSMAYDGSSASNVWDIQSDLSERASSDLEVESTRAELSAWNTGSLTSTGFYLHGPAQEPAGKMAGMSRDLLFNGEGLEDFPLRHSTRRRASGIRSPRQPPPPDHTPSLLSLASASETGDVSSSNTTTPTASEMPRIWDGDRQGGDETLSLSSAFFDDPSVAKRGRKSMSGATHGSPPVSTPAKKPSLRSRIFGRPDSTPLRADSQHRASFTGISPQGAGGSLGRSNTVASTPIDTCVRA
ncbi:MAG: hypothetical protein M1817_003090 [Caeruleum heppii]|nr:MAG: hypothetical protein M1817_003090 [Caeruleum heppii]